MPNNTNLAREKIGDIPEHKIDELDIINTLHLFKHYYKRPDDNLQILNVCACIGNHALTIELLAKTLQELPNENAFSLWQQLNDKGIDINRQQKVWANYIQKETYLNECLLVAFDLGKLNTQTAIHPVLRFFCLMPYQYITYDLIQQINPNASEADERLLLSHLKQLTNLGWLKKGQTTWDNIAQEGWQMHPVIQDIISQKLGRYVEPYNNLGILYKNKGDLNKAEEHYQKSLKIRLNLFGENHSDTAMSYNNLGSSL